METLTIEGVHDFIVSVIIPRLARIWLEDRQAAMADDGTNEEGTMPNNISSRASKTSQQENLIVDFMRANGLQTTSFNTAWRWMRLLNVKYDARRKSFYVDGHGE